jgi:hypothetical protein
MIVGAKLLDYPPQYLRGRAKQTRAMARTTCCEATLAMLEKRAAEYDRMAAILENSVSSELHTEVKLRIPRKRATRPDANRVELRFKAVRSA